MTRGAFHHVERIEVRIRRVLRREGLSSAQTVAAAIGANSNSVSAALIRMTEAGELTKIGRGLYELAARPSDASPVGDVHSRGAR